MTYYNWPEIVKSYSEYQLRRTVMDSDSEPDDKVHAAISELKSRGFEVADGIPQEPKPPAIVIEDKTVCHHCHSKGLNEADKFCPVCGFPQGGSHTEQMDFMVMIEKKKKLLDEKRRSVNKARIILYILAGINLVIGTIAGYFLKEDSVIIGSIIGGIIYLLLAWWSQSQPLPAILSGLIFFIIITVISAIMSPETILRGIIWKVLIIWGFVYGYRGAMESDRLKKELHAFNGPRDLSKPV